MEYEYPPVIEVGGHTYKVKFRDSYTLDGDEESSGRGHRNLCFIEICTKSANGEDCSLDRINEVLLHEVIHLIGDIYGADICEKQVEQLTQGILQVWKQLAPLPIKEKS